MLHKDVERVLFTSEEIKEMVRKMGETINKQYEGKELLLVIVLKGSLVFASDLMREITIPAKVDFIQASSYGKGTVSSGFINVKKDLETDVRDKHVLIIEDIVDSGNTLSKLRKLLEERKPASTAICALLSKPSRRTTHVDIEFEGAEIPDEFIVGYGLDYNECYRNLPYIGVLKREVYETA